jgi:hypothetical protein
MLLTGLGMTVFAIIRARAEALYPVTLVIRAFFLVCTSAFFLMSEIRYSWYSWESSASGSF